MTEVSQANAADFLVVFYIIIGTFIACGLILGTIEWFNTRRHRR